MKSLFALSKSLLIVVSVAISFSSSAQDLTLQLTPSNYNGFNISCFGVQDGSINLTISGGTPPYYIQWSYNFITTEDIDQLPAGYYTVNVRDKDFVHSADAAITLTEPAQLQLSASVYVYANEYNISCYHCFDGMITLNAEGGVPPYTYFWWDASTNQTHYSLGSGSYTAILIDSTGCSINSEHFYVTEPPRDDWTMAGNTGSNPATQFMGTTDSVDFVFKTNNNVGMRLKANGILDLKVGLKIDNLAGNGNQMVYIDSTGALKTIDPYACAGTTLPVSWFNRDLTGQYHDIFYCGGNVGVGILIPTEALHVYGNIRTSSLAGNGSSNLSLGGMIIADNNGVLSKISSGSANQVLSSNGWVNYQSLSQWITNGNDIYNNASGNVGIGTGITVTEKLEVNGNIKLSGNIITTGANSSLNLNDLHVQNKIKVGNSIWLGGTNTGSTTNDIYTDDADLVLNGNSSFNTIMNTNGGKVGIRTLIPSQALDVNGRINLRDGTIQKGGSPITGANEKDLGLYSLATDGWMRFVTDNGSIRFFSDGLSTPYGGTPLMVIDPNGIVGIGTSNFPDNTFNLYVTKGIRTEKIKVDLAADGGWADYVFSNNYKLKSLDELATYIRMNKHLPGIPTSDEVRKNGINLGEMQAKLLEKVEELTLYLINQQKEINGLKVELQKIRR